ncbi:DUF1540 domain-containing protein [Ureibacillus sp. 179-F W5.1 NHS]|uniref:DUF1540 domain-containing protein n=1 Tax=unclassified Ureibacillus TaxID=2638520 RepID=UPI003119518E
MPNKEANNTRSNCQGNVCGTEKIPMNRNRQSKNSSEEFASEIHINANLEQTHSNNAFEKRSKRQLESERTAWN